MRNENDKYVSRRYFLKEAGVKVLPILAIAILPVDIEKA